MPVVKPARDIKRLRRKDYRTKNIVELVNEVAKTDRDDTEQLAKRFPPTRKGLKQLFDFVDRTFTYVEDPPANQWVQTPSYFYHESRQGDCKSFTVFLSSVLYNMGVSHYIRYTAYGTKDYRHVYPVAILNGREIPLDVVWHKQEGGRFGREKSFTNKKDFKVEGLYKLGNTQTIDTKAIQATIHKLESVLADIPNSIITDGVGDITEMSSGQFDRVIMQERLEIYASQATNPALRAQYLNGLAAIKRGTVAGIGSMMRTQFGADLERFLRSTAYDNAPAFEPFQIAIPNPVFNKVGGFNPFKAIGNAFKKLFKKLVNWVFKGPARKMAPYFLFTFINKMTSSKEVNRRKSEQEKTFNWIKRVGKFDDKKLRAMVFNEIKKDTGMTPTELLNAGAENKIAAIPAAAAVGFGAKVFKALGFVVQVIKKIAGIFKKKKEDAGRVSEANAPDLKLLEELNEKPANAADSNSGGLAIAAGLGLLTMFVI